MKKPFSILFVCTGNICRSPTAEAVFRHRIREAGLTRDFTHDSAGTADYHTGAPPDARSRAALKQLGVDMEDLRARRVRKEDFYEYDLILAMDETHLHALKRMAPDGAPAEVALYLSYAHGLSGGNVPDPYYGKEADFAHVVRLANDATEALLNRLKQHKLQ